MCCATQRRRARRQKIWSALSVCWAMLKSLTQDANRPIPLNATVSSQMARMPTRDSKPELKLRSALHQLGLRYRLHRKDMPGTPDICFGPAQVAVFVDGCFWHCCPTHGSVPKNNHDWWLAKLAGNQERDRRTDSELDGLGWTPVRVWEHEDPQTAAERVAALVRERRVLAARVSRT